MFSFATGPGSVYATHNPRLVISEVHPNVRSDGSSAESHEWLEIHNPEPHSVNLKGWTIEDSQAIARLQTSTSIPEKRSWWSAAQTTSWCRPASP